MNLDVVTNPAGAVPPFFAGLLPEGRRLSGLRRALKTSADDELSLLLAVGSGPVGDVQMPTDDRVSIWLPNSELVAAISRRAEADRAAASRDAGRKSGGRYGFCHA